ncbi:MAG: hypothetical protein RTU09_05075 [Candidatus Thorarchaeota archaeon]
MSESKTEGIRVIHLVMFAIAFGLETVASWTASLFSIGIPGVGALWWPNGLQVAFGSWFGMWGVLAVTAGNILGCILAGTPVVFGASLSVWIIFQSLLPAAGFRHFGADPALKTTRDWMILIVLVLVSSAISATFGIAVVTMFGYIPAWFDASWWFAWFVWALGDSLMGILIGGILLRGLTPVVKRAGLYVEGWWS